MVVGRLPGRSEPTARPALYGELVSPGVPVESSPGRIGRVFNARSATLRQMAWRGRGGGHQDVVRLFPVEGVDGGRLERGGVGASVPG